MAESFKGIDKRAMIYDRILAGVGITTRVTLLTSTTENPSMNNVNPFATRVTSAPSKKIIGAVFTETRNSNDETDPVGTVRLRKGTLDFHIIYKERVKNAQMCILAGEPGRWKIQGVPSVIGGTMMRAYIEAVE